MNAGRIIAIVLLMTLGACDASGDGHAGARALIASRCAACPIVPGVRTAVGRVGPSPDDIASRQYLAGRFRNDRPTMVRWLMHPQAMAPGTAMPDLGLSRAQATAIASYLQRLEAH